jgi:cyclopropane fatty-acyl-phospholipid synthase-like methyltransferase
MSAEAIVSLYQRHADSWARDRGERLFEQAWLDRFRATSAPGAAVLDIGCGSGDPIARYLIEQGYALTGIDSSSAMIAICQHKFPLSRWQVADMRSLSLGVAFDGVIAWDSFFHLSHEHQRRTFPILRAHTAPGGRLMFTSGPRHGEAMGEYQGESLYHASLDGDEYRSLLDTHGFDVISHVVEDPSCGGHTIWLAQRRPA